MTTSTDTTAIVHAHFVRSQRAAAAFFHAEAGAIADACERLAGRFARGGTLFVLGSGAQASDAQHVAVEFVHPVIVGKRALPAIALTSDASVLSAAASVDPATMFAGSLETLARRDDVVFGLCTDTAGPDLVRALQTARRRGLLSVLFTGEARCGSDAIDVSFGVPGWDALVVQEVHETLYHVLWELVHVFLDHQQTVSTPAGAAGSVSEPERTLYPFLFDDVDVAAPALERARREVEQSVLAKSDEVCALRRTVELTLGDRIGQAGLAMADRIRRGGRLLAFGNGGSATDAQDAVVDCLAPPVIGWRRIPALALTNDVGVLTAVANDVGFDHVYARQVMAFAGPQDIALGISTSGASRSVIAGLEAARAKGLLTIGLSGHDGGALAQSPAVDICLTVPSSYTPRIQEVHATTWHAMLSVAHQAGAQL